MEDETHIQEVLHEGEESWSVVNKGRKHKDTRIITEITPTQVQCTDNFRSLRAWDDLAMDPLVVKHKITRVQLVFPGTSIFIDVY